MHSLTMSKERCNPHWHVAEFAFVCHDCCFTMPTKLNGLLILCHILANISCANSAMFNSDPSHFLTTLAVALILLSNLLNCHMGFLLSLS